MEWVTSSFVFVKNSPEGWAQVKFPQFSEDKTVGLMSDPDLKRIKFLETVSRWTLKLLEAPMPLLFHRFH